MKNNLNRIVGPVSVNPVIFGLLLGLNLSFSAVLSGCATSQTDTNPANSPTNPAEASQKPGAPPVSTGPSNEDKVNQLNERIAKLEERITYLSDNMTATQTTMENVLAVKKIKPVPVDSHPTTNAGETVNPPVLAKDPNAGFSNDHAIGKFRESMVLFQSEKFPESILSFSGFLQEHADHPLAGAAQFYIGESYFKIKEYKLANEEYKRVLASYDRSSYLPDTLARLVETDQILQMKGESEKHQQLLTSLFPQSPAAKIAMVSKSTGGKQASTHETTSAPTDAVTAPLPKMNSSEDKKEAHH
jgi:TolA-binding protein